MSSLTHTGRGVHTGQHQVPLTLDPVAYVGNNTIATGTLSAPAARQAGDLLIAYLAGGVSLATVLAPSGYTAGNQESIPATGMYSRIMSRVATNNGSDDVGWNINSTQQMVGLFTLRTPYATLTWPGANSNADGGSTSPAAASLTVPTATAPATGWDLIFAMTYADQADPTAVIGCPSGFDQVLQQEILSAAGGGPKQSTLAIFSRLITAGATGTTPMTAQALGGTAALVFLAQRLVLTP